MAPIKYIHHKAGRNYLTKWEEWKAKSVVLGLTWKSDSSTLSINWLCEQGWGCEHPGLQSSGPILPESQTPPDHHPLDADGKLAQQQQTATE